MRRDIQLLRGIAVLVVVLYHSKLNVLAHGYLGVDIFFVVSGFLITSIILKGLQNESFSFIQFYVRRAKRLLPALYCTLLFTSFLGLFLLTSQQWSEYIAQLVGALTFTENMVLPTQIGYFDNAADGKPLLHIWSLSLEEQYYFFLPLFLFIIPKRYRLHGLLFLFTISIAWCFSWVYASNQVPSLLWRISEAQKAEWAFYLFPTRAWELLAGSLCAWLMLHQPSFTIPAWLKTISVITLLVLCGVNITPQHPSIEGVFIVLATSFILLGDDKWLVNHKVIKTVERIGDWSYSVYLVHWPLYAFAFLAYVEQIPVWVSVLLVPVSIGLGYAQFRWVETPFRKGQFQHIFANWYTVAGTTALVFLLPVLIATQRFEPLPDQAAMPTTNYGLSEVCDNGFDKDGTLKVQCLSDGKINIAVWGDSYAMHLLPGIVKNHSGVVQITKSVCGPLIDIAPIYKNYLEPWANECLEFNNQALNYISSHSTLTHVVLSSPFHQYMNFENGQMLTPNGLVQSSYERLLEGLANSIEKIKQLGLTPIVISPPPKSGFNIKDCLDRKYSSALLLRNGCNVEMQEYQAHQQTVNQLLSQIESKAKVIWLDKLMCNQQYCETDVEGTYLYIDSGHLSAKGSQKILGQLDLTIL